ncbi:MAG: Piwi domain-containing protein, partial [Linnemannia gamsii]
IQKRHNVRPFPAQRELVDQSDNCQSGTVVDAGILHALGFDFYLHSHIDPIGTSRQAHCNVLRDDNQFTTDSIQELTYRLCYLYARCN